MRYPDEVVLVLQVKSEFLLHFRFWTERWSFYFIVSCNRRIKSNHLLILQSDVLLIVTYISVYNIIVKKP